MSARTRQTAAEAYAQAFGSFQRLSREEKLERLRRAGVLGLTPHVGDKVRVVGPNGSWRYGIVLGEREGQVLVACNRESSTVELQTLEDFSLGQAVQMVQRAPVDREQSAAARALQLVGRAADLSTFDLAPSWSGGAAMAALAAIGLAAAVVALSNDRSWDENVARYRDGRGRFSPG